MSSKVTDINIKRQDDFNKINHDTQKKIIT